MVEGAAAVAADHDVKLALEIHAPVRYDGGWVQGKPPHRGRFEVDSVEQVRRQHAMLAELVGEGR